MGLDVGQMSNRANLGAGSGFDSGQFMSNSCDSAGTTGAQCTVIQSRTTDFLAGSLQAKREIQMLAALREKICAPARVILGVAWITTLGIGTVASAQQFEDSRFMAAGLDDDDRFGEAISVSGNFMLVGAPRDDDNGVQAGAAYIFEFDDVNEVWVERQKLLASNGTTDDRLGAALALWNDIAVVGAWNDDQIDTAAGSAYIFRRDPNTGVWNEEAALIAPDGASGDNFGLACGVSDGTVVIGAWGDDAAGAQSGSAYIYMFDVDTSQWLLVGKLRPDNLVAGDRFGLWVTTSGGRTMAIGAPHDDGDIGSVYVFRRVADSRFWEEEAFIQHPELVSGDRFGRALTIDGDLLCIAAHKHVNSPPTTRGAVYMYRYSDVTETWDFEQKLFNPDGSRQDFFGGTVDLEGDTVVVGDPVAENGLGAAYLFQYDSTSMMWNEMAQMQATDLPRDDLYAFSVGVSGNHVAAGCELLRVGGSTLGAVYTYELDEMASGFRIDDISPREVLPGGQVQVTIADARPNEDVFLLFGFRFDVTFLPQYGVTLNFPSIKLEQVATTDANGDAQITVDIPVNWFDRGVGYQAAQPGQESNVIVVTVL